MEHHQPTSMIDTGSKTMAAPSKASSRKRLHSQRASQAGAVSATPSKNGQHQRLHCTDPECPSKGRRTRSDHLGCKDRHQNECCDWPNLCRLCETNQGKSIFWCPI